MTEAYYKIHRQIASLICMSNVFLILLFKPFSGFGLNGGSFSLPLVAFFILPILGFCYLYKFSNKDKRFGLLMLPITLLIVAIFSHLTRSSFN